MKKNIYRFKNKLYKCFCLFLAALIVLLELPMTASFAENDLIKRSTIYYRTADGLKAQNVYLKNLDDSGYLKNSQIEVQAISNNEKTLFQTDQDRQMPEDTIQSAMVSVWHFLQQANSFWSSQISAQQTLTESLTVFVGLEGDEENYFIPAAGDFKDLIFINGSNVAYSPRDVFKTYFDSKIIKLIPDANNIDSVGFHYSQALSHYLADQALNHYEYENTTSTHLLDVDPNTLFDPTAVNRYEEMTVLDNPQYRDELNKSELFNNSTALYNALHDLSLNIESDIDLQNLIKTSNNVFPRSAPLSIKTILDTYLTVDKSIFTNNSYSVNIKSSFSDGSGINYEGDGVITYSFGGGAGGGNTQTQSGSDLKHLGVGVGICHANSQMCLDENGNLWETDPLTGDLVQVDQVHVHTNIVNGGWNPVPQETTLSLYFSVDGVQETQLLGQQTIQALNPSTSVSYHFDIPNATIIDLYQNGNVPIYLIMKADSEDEVLEIIETNNIEVVEIWVDECKPELKITMSSSEFNYCFDGDGNINTVGNDGSLQPVQEVVLTGSIENQSVIPIDIQTYIGIYLSDNGYTTVGDAVYQFPIPPLAAGESYDFSYTIPASEFVQLFTPLESGDYYFLLLPDDTNLVEEQWEYHKAPVTFHLDNCPQEDLDLDIDTYADHIELCYDNGELFLVDGNIPLDILEIPGEINLTGSSADQDITIGVYIGDGNGNINGSVLWETTLPAPHDPGIIAYNLQIPVGDINTPGTLMYELQITGMVMPWLVLKVDHNENILETDELNNFAPYGLWVNDCTEDIEISVNPFQNELCLAPNGDLFEIDANGDQTQINDYVTVTATITNPQSHDVQDVFHVTLFDSPDGATIGAPVGGVDPYLVTGLDSYGTETISFDIPISVIQDLFQLYGSASPLYLIFSADHEDVIAEQYEDNNRGTISLHIEQCVDLYIDHDGGSVEYCWIEGQIQVLNPDTNQYEPVDLIDISTTIYNVSSGSITTDFEVGYYATDSNGNIYGDPIYTTLVTEDFGPGGTGGVDVDVSILTSDIISAFPINSSGTFTITIFVDHTNVLTEVNENNNYQSFEIILEDCEPEVDIEMTADPLPNEYCLDGFTLNEEVNGELVPVTSIDVVGTVSNPSSNDITDPFDVSVYWSPDGTTLGNLISTETINSLAAGASEDVTVTVSANDVIAQYNFNGGEVYVIFVADSNEVITESNENNNTAVVQIFVDLCVNLFVECGPGFVEYCWLDGQIQEYDPDTDTYTVVDQITVPTTVFNTSGGTITEDFEVGYYYSDMDGNIVGTVPDDAIVIETITDDLAPGDQLSFNVVIDSSVLIAGFPITGPGSYYIAAFVDHTEVVAETDEDNIQVFEIILEDCEPEVDIEMTADPLPNEYCLDAFTLNEEVNGELVPVTSIDVVGTVTNPSVNDIADPFDVSVYWSPDGTTLGNLISTETITTLGAGASENVTVTVSANDVIAQYNFNGGEVYVIFVADSGDVISESDETNNTAVVQIFVDLCVNLFVECGPGSVEYCWLDGEIQEYDPDTDTYTVVDQITIPTTVYNTSGGTITEDFEVGYYYSDMDGNIVGTVPNDAIYIETITDDLGPGDQLSFTVVIDSSVLIAGFPITGPGSYYIAAFVDHTEVVAETDEDNIQVFEIILEDCEPEVDIEMTADPLPNEYCIDGFTLNEEVNGELVPVTSIDVVGTVSNPSSNDITDPFDVSVYWSPDGTTLGNLITTETINSLAAGSSENVTVTVSANDVIAQYNFNGGEVYVIFVADSGDVISESDETNNTAVVQIFVDLCVNLFVECGPGSVEYCWLDGEIQEYDPDTDTYTVVDQITIPTTVYNTSGGTITEDFEVGYYYSDMDGNIIGNVPNDAIYIEMITDDLGPGDQLSFNVMIDSSVLIAGFPITGPGSYYIAAFVDHTEVVAETDEDNIQVFEIILEDCEPEVDLEISPDAEEMEFCVGEDRELFEIDPLNGPLTSVVFSGNVLNTSGNDVTIPTQVGIYFSEDGVTPLGPISNAITIPPVAAGDSEVYSFTIPAIDIVDLFYDYGPDLYFIVVADDAFEVNETDENNNSGVTHVIIDFCFDLEITIDTPGPTYCFKDGTFVTYDPDTEQFSPVTSITIDGSIINNAAGPLNDNPVIGVYLSDDGVNPIGTAIYTETVNGPISDINPNPYTITLGQNEIDTIISGLGITGAGTYYLILIVDHENLIFELDETNNSATFSIIVEDCEPELVTSIKGTPSVCVDQNGQHYIENSNGNIPIDSISIPTSIKNNGQYPTTSTGLISLKDANGNTVPASFNPSDIIPTLGPGENYVAVMTFDTSLLGTSPGLYPFTICFEGDDYFEEYNFSIVVDFCPLPDIMPTSPNAELCYDPGEGLYYYEGPAGPEQLDVLNFTAVVNNMTPTPPADTGSFEFEIYYSNINDFSTATLVTPVNYNNPTSNVINNLGAATSILVDVDLPLSILNGDGTYYIWIVVDTGDDVLESNENNNSVVLELVVPICENPVDCPELELIRPNGDTDFARGWPEADYPGGLQDIYYTGDYHHILWCSNLVGQVPGQPAGTEYKVRIKYSYANEGPDGPEFTIIHDMPNDIHSDESTFGYDGHQALTELDVARWGNPSANFPATPLGESPNPNSEGWRIPLVRYDFEDQGPVVGGSNIGSDFREPISKTVRVHIEVYYEDQNGDEVIAASDISDDYFTASAKNVDTELLPSFQQVVASQGATLSPAILDDQYWRDNSVTQWDAKQLHQVRISWDQSNFVQNVTYNAPPDLQLHDPATTIPQNYVRIRPPLSILIQFPNGYSNIDLLNAFDLGDLNFEFFQGVQGTLNVEIETVTVLREYPGAVEQFMDDRFNLASAVIEIAPGIVGGGGNGEETGGEIITDSTATESSITTETSQSIKILPNGKENSKSGRKR